MKVKKIPVHVRQALAEGNIVKANTLLGNLYSLRGIVVKGRQLGRTLGYPTANLKLNEINPLFLANGVYAVTVTLNGSTFNGMANIGIRPTMDDHQLTVEVNLFDFEENIYDQELIVHFIERVRDEKKFGTLDELKEQISKDKVRISEILLSRMHPDPNTK